MATTNIYQIHLSSTVVSEQHIIGLHTRDIHCNYYDWIPAWTSHMKNQSSNINVPPTATAITSPLIMGNWMEALADHPNRPLVNFFITGVSEGFHIGFKQPPNPLKSAKHNLSCALQDPETVDKYLAEEIALGRVANPFQQSLVPQAHISRFGVIPKNHHPNK